MLEQRAIDFGQTFQNGVIRGNMLAQADKCPYHKHTHLDRPLAAKNVRGHHGTMFRESPGAIPTPAVGGDHNL